MRMKFKFAGIIGFAGRSVAATALFTLILAPTVPGQAQNTPAKAAGNKVARASVAEIQKNLDRAWVKKAFVNDMMDHWLTASVMPSGFIQENLDREWKPWGTQREASLNGQGRVLYTLATAYEVSGDKRYLDAMTTAADFLLKMHDDEFGGYYNRVTPELKVIDDTKGSFQSFAIFSLAHVGRVSKNQKYTKAALDAYHELKAKMSDGLYFRQLQAGF